MADACCAANPALAATVEKSVQLPAPPAPDFADKSVLALYDSTAAEYDRRLLKVRAAIGRAIHAAAPGDAGSAGH